MLSAKNEVNKITENYILDTEILQANKPNSYLLRIKVNLKSLDGQPIGARYFIDVNATVRDSSGNNYPYWATGFPGFHINVSNFRKGEHQGGGLPSGPESEIDYIFTIPNDAKIIDFTWKDLSPIELEIK